MMRRSFNEVEMMARKAAVGAGLPIGLAEDAGRAGAALCRLGIDGAAVVCQALSNLEAGNSIGTQLVSVTASATCALRDVPSALDDLIAHGNGAERVLKGVDAPIALLGLVVDASRNYEIAFKVTLGHRVLWASPSGVVLANLPDEAGIDVKLRQVDQALIPPAQISQASQAQCNPDAWARLEALAKLTYVPASEASRTQGAGAGLLDND